MTRRGGTLRGGVLVHPIRKYVERGDEKKKETENKR